MNEGEAAALANWFKCRKGKTLKLNDRGIDCVVEALEKQIPKKPKITRTSALITFGICPSCGTEIDCLDNPFYHKDSDCLQKLDWSDIT